MCGDSMKIQSSYIFLPMFQEKIKKEERSDNKTHIELGHSVYSILKNSFNFSNNDIIRLGYYKKDINTIIKVDKTDFDVKFSINEVAENTYLDIVVSNKSRIKAIRCLEYINEILNGDKFEEHYILITSYDAVSEYYCNKIYPKLNEIERMLRKLLFNIYIVNFGKDYYKKTVNSELQNKIKSVVQAKGNNEKKEIERLKRFFYSFEYTDIQSMLFEKKWTIIEEQKKVEFLNKHSDLSELSDKQIRDAFEDFSPKSDWERFFGDKVTGIDFKSLIEDIRLSRNNIAHCKFFYWQEYQHCLKSISKLKSAINKAIKRTEDIDFSQINSESLKAVFASVSEMAAEFQQRTNGIFKVLQPVFNNLSKYLIEQQRIMIQGINLSAFSEVSKLNTYNIEQIKLDTDEND